MNLGQLVGELRLKAEGALPGVPLPGKRSRARGVRFDQALAIGRARGGDIVARDLMHELGISRQNADNLLYRMVKEGKMEKVGYGKFRVPA